MHTESLTHYVTDVSNCLLIVDQWVQCDVDPAIIDIWYAMIGKLQELIKATKECLAYLDRDQEE
jgi:hypothetical protein